MFKTLIACTQYLLSIDQGLFPDFLAFHSAWCSCFHGYDSFLCLIRFWSVYQLFSRFSALGLYYTMLSAVFFFCLADLLHMVIFDKRTNLVGLTSGYWCLLPYWAMMISGKRLRLVQLDAAHAVIICFQLILGIRARQVIMKSPPKRICGHFSLQ